MIKKRKTKGSKFAQMNEEERVRYMQHRTEFELEAKRRKQQLIATFTKNKLKHEEISSKLNTAKINEKWRYFLRLIKCKELHENVKYLCTTFDRVIKIKDATISYLHSELKTANADHRKLQEAHIVLMKNMIGQYKQKLKALHKMYEFNNIKNNDIVNLPQLENHVQHSYKEIFNNITRKVIILDKTLSIRKTQNAVNVCSILYLEEDIVSDLVQHSFLSAEDLWQQLCKIIDNYKSMIESKKKQYEYLKEQNVAYQTCILQYPEVHLQLQTIIESLKYNIEILSLNSKERITKLKIEDIRVKKRFKNIKHKFAVTQMIDSSQLKQLIVTSNEVLKHLQKTVEKGSAIIEIIRICSSLEPLSFILKKYFIQNAVCTEFADINVPELCIKVNNFWEHYNHIKVNNILLKRESNKLCTENKKLKHQFQAYFTKNSGKLALYPILSPSI
ncbi:Dynein regulatory complex subunit 2 [Anthophora retusa]